jgi:predicted metal-binding protein
VRSLGKVEKMPIPGAARSTKIGSWSEKSGTFPDRLSAPTPITCGSAAGQLAYGQGVAYASSEFPTAATTIAPCLTAYATACASTFEYVSRAGLSGSRTAPKLMLMTRAPCWTAQRMASASALRGIVPSEATTLATTSWEE